MSLGKTVGVVVVALLMVVSAVGASGALAVDRTATDSERVAEAVESEGGYEELTAELQSNARDDIERELESASADLPDGITFHVESDELAERAISEQFVEETIDRQLEQLIAYLEGESDDLELVIDLEPVRVSVIGAFDADAIEVDSTHLAQQADLDTADHDIEVTDEMIVDLNADQAGYDAVRFDIRSQALEAIPVAFDEDEPGSVSIDTVTLAQEIDFDPGASDLEVTDEMIVDLNEDADGYVAVRSDIREQIREELPPGSGSAEVDATLRTVNAELKTNSAEQAESEYGDDVSEATLQRIIELQDTVIDGLTDPDLDDFSTYETRRTTDETELEAALDTEIDDGLREAGAELRDEAAQEVQNRYGDDVSPDTIDAIVALQNTVIDGLTDPDFSDFEAYESQREADESTLEMSLANEIQAEITAEFDEQIDLAEEFDEEDGETLQSGFGLAGSLALVLPLVVIGLVGATYAISRSVARTVMTTGVSLLVAGILGVALAIIGGGLVLDLVASAGPGGGAAGETVFVDVVFGIVDEVFTVLRNYSLVLTALGLSLVIGVYADRTGYFERIKPAVKSLERSD